MPFSLPGKCSHDRNSPDYVPSVFFIFKISSQDSTDRYQRYLKRQENENSLTDGENTHDIGQPLLESSVIQSAALSASTEDISNEDSSLTFHVSGENTVKKYKEDKKLMNFYTGLLNNELFSWVLSLLDEEIFKSSKLSKGEHLLLVLMKLKLDL